uniref:Large ribosomal subunit protein uL10 n=1 Tax=Otolemur garnettii TaxID=30611 RepID=H0XP69_OTOGA
EGSATWKSSYFLKIIQLLDDYLKGFIVGADDRLQADAAGPHVPSRDGYGADGEEHHDEPGHQGYLENRPALERLLPPIWGNVGLVFTKEDLTEIRDILWPIRCQLQPMLTPSCEVTVPAQNTGLGPEKISFFQALKFPGAPLKPLYPILSSMG